MESPFVFWPLIVVGIFLYVFIGKIVCNVLDIRNPWDSSSEFFGVILWPVIAAVMIPVFIIVGAVELANYLTGEKK